MEQKEQQLRQQRTTTNNKKTTPKGKTTTSNRSSTTRLAARKTSKLKGKTSEMVLEGQNSITQYLELRSMDTSKLTETKVLCDPIFNTELLSMGKTTEAKNITFQTLFILII